MDINTLIDQGIDSLKKLPENKVYEVLGYINFLYVKHSEESVLQKGIEEITSQSKSFSFLNEEEDIYEENDLIEKY